LGSEDTFKRSAQIDALRAVVLAGVIIMNMMTFSGLAYLTPDMRTEWLSNADQAVWTFIRIFIDDKALAAFSFLFGFSFSLTLRKSPSLQDASARFFRRLAVLFLFGLFNALFLFWADILMTYALLGLFLPLAARLPTPVIVALALSLVLAGPLTLALGGFEIPTPVPRGHVENLDAFASPAVTDTIRQNWHMLFNAPERSESLLFLRFFTLLGLFLLGLAAGNSGILTTLAGDRARLLRLGLSMALTGLLMNLALRFIGEPTGLLTLLNLESPIMALGYLMLIGALLEGPSADRFRKLLAPLGRMTLSGYLLTAVCGQLFFYGWGLGMIGTLGTSGVLAVAATTFVALVAFSQFWLRRFPFGPWEWAWRYLTNLRLKPPAESGITR
jgi:uncharacterized protein